MLMNNQIKNQLKGGLKKMTEDYEQEKTSEFNEALLQIQRLHYLWMRLATARESGHLKMCEQILISVQTELQDDANRLDSHKKTGFIKKLDELNKNMINAHKFKEIEEEDDDERKNRKKLQMQGLFNSIVKKELLLRELQNASGKGSKYQPKEERL